MKIGRQFRGTPAWGEVIREDSSFIGCTHKQTVSFIYANKYYTGTFCRWFDKNAPIDRISYTLDVVRDQTGRNSHAMSEAMLRDTQWLSTFKRNVQEWADNL